MALVHEETKHEYLDAEIMVSQRQRGETIEDWDICHLEVESMWRRTPDELVELGEWLVAQGKRIKGAYRKNGAPRTAGVQATVPPAATDKWVMQAEWLAENLAQQAFNHADTGPARAALMAHLATHGVQATLPALTDEQILACNNTAAEDQEFSPCITAPDEDLIAFARQVLRNAGVLGRQTTEEKNDVR